MSYRSLKRVLGETKLELKTLFLFGICLLTLISASFYWYGSRTEEQVYEQNRWLGRGLVDAIIVTHHWAKLSEKNPDFNGETVKDMMGFLRDGGYTWSFLRPGASDGMNAPQDEFDAQVLDDFRRAPPPPPNELAPYRFRRLPELQKYVYYQPVHARDTKPIPESKDGHDTKPAVELPDPHDTNPALDPRKLVNTCVACHNTYRPSSLGIGSASIIESRPPLAEGDLMAVVKVVIPDKETQKALSWNNALLWATAIVTVFLAVVVSYLIIRYVIVKPLKHLRDVSDEVTQGNLQLRADIRTGDEFEDLAAAFNRMLRHLVDSQSELSQLNNNLNVKVDELAQANMQLYEMGRLKSDFLATMSHELRTPLNSIIGFSDVLSAIASLDDRQKRYVQNIQKSGRVLLDMINDILDLAKIESGKMEVRPSDFHIEQLIHAQCDMARPLTERKNIDLDIDAAANVPLLHQDQGKVQQILNNLLSNAIKFTPDGGRIIVRARFDGHGDLLLSIEDTGIGIAEEDQVAIFEKFRQGGAVLPGGEAITREYSGTGLGLSIVKELCKLLGGEISVVSQLGQGSTFTVRLPVSRRATAPKLELPPADLVEEPLLARRNELRRAEEVLTAGRAGGSG